MVILSKMEHYSFALYAIIIFLEGAFINGSLNSLSSNELMKAAGKNPVKLDLYTTALFTLASFAVGLAQLMIGLFMASSSDGGESFSAVFLVLIILGSLALLMVGLRSYRIYQNINKTPGAV